MVVFHIQQQKITKEMWSFAKKMLLSAILRYKYKYKYKWQGYPKWGRDIGPSGVRALPWCVAEGCCANVVATINGIILLSSSSAVVPFLPEVDLGVWNFAYAFLGIGGDVWRWLCIHVRRNISADVDGGLSEVSRVGLNMVVYQISMLL